MLYYLFNLLSIIYLLYMMCYILYYIYIIFICMYICDILGFAKTAGILSGEIIASNVYEGTFIHLH